MSGLDAARLYSFQIHYFFIQTKTSMSQLLIRCNEVHSGCWRRQARQIPACSSKQSGCQLSRLEEFPQRALPAPLVTHNDLDILGNCSLFGKFIINIQMKVFGLREDSLDRIVGLKYICVSVGSETPKLTRFSSSSSDKTAFPTRFVHPSHTCGVETPEQEGSVRCARGGHAQLLCPQRQLCLR